ncbi:MAG TPA: acetyl-CoA C-acetyltransferase [Candidatus Limnocylindrales bacterium]|nr:acetyl-CoA C-acetyltransferase [Candidatus Limnocylindrales bacterium]
MGNAYIIDAVRTPRGKGKQTGSLARLHPHQLLGTCLKALTDRNEFDPRDVEDVVAGCVTPVAEQGGVISRFAVLDAGWPTEVTGVQLNRYCGSGQQAVNFALMGAASGFQDLVVGGGVEQMSRLPMGSDKSGLDAHNRHLREQHPLVPQGISADLIASREGFTREDCDKFALRSQQNCKRAMAEGRFDKSIIPVRDYDGTLVLDRDEFPRPETTLEGLSRLEPSFAAMGPYVQKGDTLSFDDKARKVYPEVAEVRHVHTAGNSSGIVDGASAVLIASEKYVRERGVKPRARVLSMATIGDEPVIMLTAPAPASERALKKAGMDYKDIDLFEVNEAFAAVVLKFLRESKVDPDRVNVNGGAIALGHPLGATGGMLIGTALDELERSDKTTALITMCIGGGMGIATIIERC